MNIKDYIQKLEIALKNNPNLFFSQILIHLKKRYKYLHDGLEITDFYVNSTFHSITLIKQNDILNIELHENYLELRINSFLIGLYNNDYPEDIFYLIIDSSLNGEYTTIEDKDVSGNIISFEITWSHNKLSNFNSRERRSLLKKKGGTSETRQGVSYLKE